jgi:hypothetical protein
MFTCFEIYLFRKKKKRKEREKKEETSAKENLFTMAMTTAAMHML